MSKLAAIALLSACFLFPAYSYGQTSSPAKTSDKPKTKTTSGQKKIVADQRGTEKQPLSIKGEITTQQTEEDTAKLDKEREEKSAHDEQLVVETGQLAQYTLLLAGFTGGLMVFTFLLWLANRTLIQDARRNANQELRAYVYADVVMIGLSPGSDNVIVSIKNFGKTPAYNVSCVVAITFDPPTTTAGRPPLERFIELFPARIDIPPSGAFRPFLRNDFSDASRTEMQEGRKTLFLFGIIRYRDAFNGNRETEFRYIYRPDRAVAEGQWEPTPEGNHST